MSVITNEEMLAACHGGILLPVVGAAAPVTFRPDTLEWDAGILMQKAGRQLFISVVEAIGNDEWLADETAFFKKAAMPCVAVVARTPDELTSTGSRVWIYNPRIHGMLPISPIPPVSPALSLPVEAPATIIAPVSILESAAETPISIQPELFRAEDEMLSVQAAWVELGKEADAWNAAEQARARLMDGEQLEQTACRLLGQNVGIAWMNMPLLLLGGQTPREDSKTQHGLARCLSILRKVSLVQI